MALFFCSLSGPFRLAVHVRLCHHTNYTAVLTVMLNFLSPVCNSVNWNRSELLNRTENSNTYYAAAHKHKPLLLSRCWLFYFQYGSIILTGILASIRVICSYFSRPFLCALGTHSLPPLLCLSSNIASLNDNVAMVTKHLLCYPITEQTHVPYFPDMAAIWCWFLPKRMSTIPGQSTPNHHSRTMISR